MNKNSKKLAEVTNHEEDSIHFRRDCIAIYDSSCSIYWESWPTSCQKTAIDRAIGLCTLYGKHALESLLYACHILKISRSESPATERVPWIMMMT